MRFHNSGLNHKQQAWLAAALDKVNEKDEPATAELQCFLSKGELDIGCVTNLNEPETMWYRPTLRGVAIVGKFDDLEVARKEGEAQRQEWADLTKHVELPAFLLDTSDWAAICQQKSEHFVLSVALDLKSFYVEPDVAEVYDGFSENPVSDWIEELREYPESINETLQPLLALIPKTQVDEGDEDEEDDITPGADNDEIAYLLMEAGFFGYIVQVKTPLREYRSAEEEGFSFSYGSCRTQYFYLDDLKDLTAINAWLETQVAEWKDPTYIEEQKAKREAARKRAKSEPVFRED